MPTLINAAPQRREAGGGRGKGPPPSMHVLPAPPPRPLHPQAAPRAWLLPQLDMRQPLSAGRAGATAALHPLFAPALQGALLSGFAPGALFFQGLTPPARTAYLNVAA